MMPDCFPQKLYATLHISTSNIWKYHFHNIPDSNRCCGSSEFLSVWWMWSENHVVTVICIFMVTTCQFVHLFICLPLDLSICELSLSIILLITYLLSICKIFLHIINLNFYHLCYKHFFHIYYLSTIFVYEICCHTKAPRHPTFFLNQMCLALAAGFLVIVRKS